VTDVEEDLPAIVHTDPRSPGDLTPIVLDCEYALLGALLRADTVEQAASVLAAVADEDFANPWVQRAIVLTRVVVGEGVVPAASVLLARLTTEQGVHQYQLMGDLLVAAWWAGPPPIAAWSLVVAVLEASYRRAARCWADRVRQASDGPLDVLVAVLSDYVPVRAAWRRLTTARRTTRRTATAVPARITYRARRIGASDASVGQAWPA
jgi:hypothetical protein